MDITRQSLLIRAQDGQEKAWEELLDLYRPLLVNWLRRQSIPSRELDDLAQDILLTVIQQIGRFSHSGQTGAFRSWLRLIAQSRVCDFWRAYARQPSQAGSTMAADAIRELEDTNSELNRLWDQEHDHYVLRYLLDQVELEHSSNDLLAFRRVALEGASASEVAAEIGLSLSAVYVAKSRILQKLRQLAEGLID